MDELFPTLPADFGRYRILRKLGKGGMGEVYLAEDTKLGRRLTAIKIPTKAMDADSATRFQREADASARLKHPNICNIYDVGEIAGRAYLATEFIEGTGLDRLVGKGKQWPAERAIPLVMKLCEAFQYAHDNGVIHRDIKPANIMLRANDDPVVMDFGLARIVGDATMTQAGVVFGTPHYMSLEQARGDLKNIGPHSDVYSLGVMFFEMLSGQRPYTGDTPLDLLARIAFDPIPPLRTVQPTADITLENLCIKAMAKNREDRYQTMKAYGVALEAYRPAEPTFLHSLSEPLWDEPHSPEILPSELIPVAVPRVFRATCPGCSNVMKFRPNMAGKTGKCPKCLTRVILPNADGQLAIQKQTPSQSTQSQALPVAKAVRPQSLVKTESFQKRKADDNDSDEAVSDQRDSALSLVFYYVWTLLSPAWTTPSLSG